MAPLALGQTFEMVIKARNEDLECISLEPFDDHLSKFIGMDTEMTQELKSLYMGSRYIEFQFHGKRKLISFHEIEIILTPFSFHYFFIYRSFTFKLPSNIYIFLSALIVHGHL